MTNQEYETHMDLIVQSFRTANMMVGVLSEEELKTIEQTLSYADSIGYLFSMPLDYPNAMKRVAQQRKLLNWVCQTKLLYEELRAEAVQVDGSPS